jgi:hypothetical protein
MAAHAIERAARLYVGTQAPLAIWLVPSDAIRSQTLEALKTAGHPYREALLQHYPADRLTVLDIADCEQLRAQDFGGRAIVAVGTIQTLRLQGILRAALRGPARGGFLRTHRRSRSGGAALPEALGPRPHQAQFCQPAGLAPADPDRG